MKDAICSEMITTILRHKICLDVASFVAAALKASKASLPPIISQRYSSITAVFWCIADSHS